MSDDSTTSKRCTICKNPFPATSEFFSRNKSKKDGLGTECKVCDSARRKAHTQTHREQEYESRKRFREENAERIREEKRLYRETHKEQIAAHKKEWQQGESYKDYQRRYHQEHVDEIHALQRQRYQEDRDNRTLRQRQYLQTPQGRIVDKAHKQNRKAQKRASKGSYTSQELKEQMMRQKSKCYHCKAKLSKIWHADHILPLSKGGSNTIDNIVVSCPTCNMRRKNKLLHEWPEGGHLL